MAAGTRALVRRHGRATLRSAMRSAGGSHERSRRRETFETGSEVILVLAAAQGISRRGWGWFQVGTRPSRRVPE